MADSNEVKLQLQLQAQEFKLRLHSYELVQKLTFFVISAELVFCGYILLNTDKLKTVQGVRFFFAVCGGSACCGLLWRFFYNETYHNHAHRIDGLANKLAYRSQIVCYWLYVSLSIITFGWGMVSGYNYLSKAVETPTPACVALTKVPPPAPVVCSQPPAAAPVTPTAGSGDTMPDTKAVKSQ